TNAERTNAGMRTERGARCRDFSRLATEPPGAAGGGVEGAVCGAEQRSLGLEARAARAQLHSRGALSERSAQRARSELRRASPRRAAQGSRLIEPTAAVSALDATAGRSPPGT